MEGQDSGGSFDDFSVEMGEYEIKKTGSFDRIYRINTGGSMAQLPLLYRGNVYFGSFNHNFYCLNAKTGEMLWKFEARDRIGVAAPIVSERDGIVYIGSYDQNFYALDAMSGKLLWKFKTEGVITTRAVVCGNAVCFGSADRSFYALDTKTGALKWKFSTMGRVTSDPTATDDGKVMFGSHDHNFYCVDVPTGRLIWKHRTEDEIVNSGPFAVENDSKGMATHVYMTSMDSILYKLSIKDGSTVWKKKMASYGLCCAPTINGNRLFVPTDDGNLFMTDLDGNIAWKFSTTKPLGVVTAFKDRVYFTCEDQNVYCLDASTGNLIWKFHTQEMNWWGVAIDPVLNIAYFCSYDCHAYALNAQTGEVVWKFRSPGSPSTMPSHYDMFEASIKVAREQSDDMGTKRYGLHLGGDGDDEVSAYKSRITYRMSTQYGAKGKYQVNSDEESF